MVFGEGETAIETWKITKEKSCEVCLDVMVTPVQFAATAPLMYFIIRRLLSFIIDPRHFSSSLFSFVFLHFLECFFRISSRFHPHEAKPFMAEFMCRTDLLSGITSAIEQR